MSRLPKTRRPIVALFLILSAAVAIAQSTDTYTVVHTYPHDAQAFTQGLIFLDGHLYESTGIVGKSSLREEDAETGRILAFHDVPAPDFAEGLTDWGNTLIQLTWQNHVIHFYDRATLRLLRTLPYPYDGWGLTHDGKSLITSDGTATLHFLDPVTLQETSPHRSKRPRQARYPAQRTRVHTRPGLRQCLAHRSHRPHRSCHRQSRWLDRPQRTLPPSDRSDREAVLNGIAYDAAHDRLFVTGKLWPKLFEIKLKPEPHRREQAPSGP